jgi:hypothetical protein
MNKIKAISKMINPCLLIMAFINLFGCINSNEKSRHSTDIKEISPIGYNLSYPDKIMTLPTALREISGITLIDSTSVACIQDENGIVFIFDMSKNEIINYFPFYSDGDYEDIAKVDSNIFVLRSDGVLLRISDYESRGHADKIYSVGIPTENNEGLCFDRKNNRLLIAPKSNFGRGSEYEEKHPVYGFDLYSEILLDEPVFDFDLPAINKFASGNKSIDPGEDKSRISYHGIVFKPSAIGIHPVTNKLYILSSAEHFLFVFSMNGAIDYIGELNPGIFDAPEGIAFFDNGDMLISNEGKSGPPTLLRFNYNQK